MKPASAGFAVCKVCLEFITMRLLETRPGGDGLPGPERLLAVLALVTGTLMAVVDTTMINLALPTIAADLNVPAWGVDC